MPLDAFTRNYLTAALFTEDTDPRSGEFEEHGDWTIANIEEASLNKMIDDCATFQTLYGALIDGDEEHAGRDFWYTRNGHGCGFWDGDWAEEIGETLTMAAHGYGEQDLYIGDDGKLHV